MSDWDTTDDFSGGGNYLHEPGTYHLVVTNVLDGMSKKNKPIEGFTVECDVLAGTVNGCAGKKVDLTFFPPNPSKSEVAQRISRQQNTAFFIATNVIDPSKLGQRVTIEPTNAAGHQLVVKLVRGQEQNEVGEWVDSDKFLRVEYANVWHVDDPDAKDVPKNKDALGMIAKEHRHDEAWFAFKKKDKPAAGKQEKQPAMAASDFNDL